MKVKNPWHDQSSSYSSEFYTVPDRPMHRYKNGAIYKIMDKDYLYVINGNAQTERAGASKDILKAFVDNGANGFVSHEDNWRMGETT